jgi:CHAT domain-containing protein/Flp pilus assembly protein TadD
MLKRLVEWLNIFWKRVFGRKRTRSQNRIKRQNVVHQAPELTNADLEVLYNQLLEGVYQARGQQWAQKYLQRMENRISVDRWLDWLLNFGEKLLASPAPNNQLATRMVQLGELGVGVIGDLSYDIGIRLLTRNLGEISWEENEENAEHTTSTAILTSIEIGDVENFEELEWEYEAPVTQTIAQDVPRASAKGGIQSCELVWEHQAEEAEESVESISPTLEETQSEEELVENFRELVWEYQAEESIAPTLEETLSEEELIENFRELVWEYQASEAENITPVVEEVISDRLMSVGETLMENTPEESAQTTWDDSLANLEPDVAQTLDELLVRLDQSTSLVQQLASGLAIHSSEARQLISTDTQAQEWFYQGLQLAKTGDLSGAIACYDEALQINPSMYDVWFNRGLTLFHLGQLSEAIASYDRALLIKQDSPKAWYNRGGILGELGQFEEAIASLDVALEIQPNNEEAWSSRGFALLKLGRLSEAVSSYDKALDLQPEDPQNWYYRGIALAVDQRNLEAIASYDNALLIDPDYPEVWIDRGVVLGQLGQWSEAIESWDKALEIQPHFYLIWFNRGIALDNLGRKTEAIASYHKAIEINPEFHLAWYNQAVALFHIGEFVEAIAAYDGALQLQSDYWEAWIGRGTSAGMAVNPILKEGDYDAKLISYEAGLDYVRQDTQQEGWGRLHLAIANAHYDRGKRHPTPRYYWRQAVSEYNQALLTLTQEDFPQLHLEVLQNFIKALIGLGEITYAQELLQYATDVWQRLLNEPSSEESKKQLALKFASFGQLAVDLAIQSGEWRQALEIAEYNKNACLTWLICGWIDDISSPNYPEIQQLLNPTTAIIYWHISPYALRTFIIKDNAPEPIPVFTPIISAAVSDEFPLPEAVQILVELEDWLDDWNQQYQEYRSLDQNKQSKDNHSWLVDMEQRLLHLKNILNISTIEHELEGINKLILIPHRDLHRFPLHALFSIYSEEESSSSNANYTITYLPSAQIGLSLNSQLEPQGYEEKLLSIEHPNSTDYPPLKFAKLESETISQMFNKPKRYQGAQATKNVVEYALSCEYNIFHFTGHATDNFIEPKKSQLVLSGEDKLTLEEICEKTLTSYNLVTLSACETAITSKQTITTEYLGLANGFLNRGSAHVIRTLWTVESTANALLMIEFYRRRQPNKLEATALAEATKWLKELTVGELNKWYENLLSTLPAEEFRFKAYLATEMYRTRKVAANEKLYNQPYYWAAFTIAGKVITEVKESKNLENFYALILDQEF